MSTTVVRMVEVRNEKENKWELVHCLIPFRPENFFEPERVMNDVVEFDGKKWLKKYDYSDNACSLRDYYLSSRGWEHTNFSSRGFPDDMSDDLKEIVARHDAEVKKDQEEIKEDEKTLGKYAAMFHSDWWYNKSYVTVDELDNLFESELAKWKADVASKHEKLVESGKLQEILDILKKESSKAEEDDESIEYLHEDLEELMDEGFWKILSIEREIYLLNKAADELSGIYSSSNIRMVYYFE